MSSNIKILIVEDESVVALDIKKTLEALGYIIAGAVRTGEEGVEKARELKPDLILMDIMLGPGINGIEAAAKIRRDMNIPIIFLTAYADNVTLQNAKLTEPFGYLLKPFDTRMLFTAIEMALHRHKSEVSIIQGEERYKNLTEHSPLAILMHNNREIIYANSAAVSLFGAESASALKARPVYEIFHPFYQKAEAERIAKLSETVSIKSVEEKIIRFDGEIVDVEISSSLISFLGEPLIQYIIKDITASKKKEQTLEATLKILYSAQVTDSLEELYSNIYKSLNEILPIKNFFIAFFNHSNGEILYPFVKEEYPSLPVDKDFDNLAVFRVIETGKSCLMRQEEIVRFNPGYLKNTDKELSGWFGVPLKINENLTGVLALKSYKNHKFPGYNEAELLEMISYPVATAIERKIIEDERKRNNEYLKDLNATKDKFFSTISHDLRSPFNALLGFVEILKDEFDDLSEEEKKEYINTLYSSTNNIYMLLNNLLEFSKYRVGRFEFSPVRLNLQEVIYSAVNTVSGAAAKKKIELKIEVDEEIDIYADENMMHSVLINLISNAIKFTQRQGNVLVSSGLVKNFAEISVIDNGIGMDKNTLADLFKLDLRISTPGTDEEYGTGLGLLITREYVEKNGGNILVKSEKGKGSSFTFTVPLFA